MIIKIFDFYLLRCSDNIVITYSSISEQNNFQKMLQALALQTLQLEMMLKLDTYCARLVK